MDIDQLESELVHLKDLHTLSNARLRAIEKIGTAPTDIEGIARIVTELSIKCEIQAEIISLLKQRMEQKDRIIVNMANKQI